jgi:hypothetical protein
LVNVLGSKFAQTSFSKSIQRSYIQEKNNQSLSEQIEAISLGDNIDYLLPIGAQSVFEVNNHREKLSKVVSFALAPSKSINLASNKADLFIFASEVGVNVPQTTRVKTYSSFLETLDSLTFPFVIKSSTEAHKFGPVYIRNSKELEDLINGGSVLPEFLFGELVIQPLISGPGEGFFALYQNGACKRIMMHRRLREIPSTGGSSWAAESIFERDLQDQGMSLLDALSWHGPAMVEFKRDSRTGELSLMELNPKFWGSLDLAISSGVDFPSDTVRVASGENLKANFEYQSNIKFVWPLDSFSSYLRDKEIKKQKPLSNLMLSDPLPAVVSLAIILATPIITAIRKSTFTQIVYWSKKYDNQGLMSRIVGQILGIPLRRHCEVSSSIWVGAKPKTLGKILLRKKRMKIVSLLPEDQSHGIKEADLILPLDEFVELPYQRLEVYSEQLSKMIEAGDKIFVHCREGVGRAPSLVIAKLVNDGIKLDLAISMVSNSRKVTNLNDKQKASLIFFDSKVSKSNRKIL